MDVVGALNYLAKHVVPGAPASQAPPMARGDMDETGPLTAPVLCQVLAWLQPRGRDYCGRVPDDRRDVLGLQSYWGSTVHPPHAHGRRHRQRPVPRGRRGRRLSASTAGQLPGRRLGALLDAGALVSRGREGLDVTTIICKNDAYRILDIERATQGLKGGGGSKSALRICRVLRRLGARSRAATASRAFP